MTLGALQNQAMKAGLRALQGDPKGIDDLVKLGAFVVGVGLFSAGWWFVLFGNPPGVESSGDEAG